MNTSDDSEIIRPSRFSDPIAAADKASEVLASTVAGFGSGAQVRDGQNQMVRAVATAIETTTKVSVRAPTGTGKSLGYLVPLVASGKRGVVVVSSLALQDQLAQHDLPFLEQAVGPVDWAVVKGRARYVCLHKLQDAKAAVGKADQNVLFESRVDDVLSEEAVDQVHAVLDWAYSTPTGDLVELPFELVDEARRLVVAGNDECIGRDKCPQADMCYSENARARAKEAQVAVVNSSLFAMDIALDGRLLGQHDARAEVVIVDEAHEAEDAFANALATTVSVRRLRSLAASAARLVPKDADKDLSTPPGQTRRAVKELRRVTDDHAEFTTALAESAGEILDSEINEDHPLFHPYTEMQQAVYDLDRALNDFIRFAGGTTTRMGGRVARVATFAKQQAQAVGAMTSPLKGDSVWVDGNGQDLVRSPVNMAQVMRAKGVWKDRAVVLTSATLPKEIAVRLGFAPEDRHLIVDSPFNPREQSRLYIPSGLPETKDPAWKDAAWEEMQQMIRAAGGRTLALFTSLANMEHFAARARAELPFPVLVQGDAPKPILTQQFTDNEESCLFASSSFFTGVNVPGPSLSLVIIDKIPFPRPDDPLWVARRRNADAAFKPSKKGEKMQGFPVRREAGQDGKDNMVWLVPSFGSVDVPRAAALLAQGAGRLIRSQHCRGVVMVLDPRLRGDPNNPRKWRYRHLLLDEVDAATVGNRAAAIRFLADALNIPEPEPLWATPAP